MTDNDDDLDDHDTVRTPAPPTDKPTVPDGRSVPASLTPIIVEDADDDVGVVWLSASRSELRPGAQFVARGRRWVITGRSPSGVTYACREVGRSGRS